MTDKVNGWEKKRSQGCLQVQGMGTLVVSFPKMLTTGGKQV